MMNDGSRFVGLLTHALPVRRFSGGWLVFIFAATFAGAPAKGADTAEHQSVEQITRTAQEFLEHRIADTGR